VRRAAQATALVALALALGCKHRRQPIVMNRDAGPLVEVVDPATQKLPKQPLVDEHEPDDDVAHAQPLTLGSGIRGTLAPPHTVKNRPAGDEDVYSWLQPGTPATTSDASAVSSFDYARVELSGVPGLDLALEILDGDGHRLWLANDGGVGEGEIAPNVAVDPAHTYYLRVREVGTPKGDANHPYELYLATWHAGPGDEREPNDDAARATPIALGGTSTDATGFWGKKRDDDWLRINVAGLPADKGNATLRLELTPVEGVAPQLRIMSDKQVVGEARASRGEELRLRNVGVDPAAGGLVVALRALEGRSTEIRWVLRIGVEPTDPVGAGGAEREPDNDVAHATQLQLTGGTAQVSGFLWPGDSDVFHVQGVPAEALLQAEIEGLDKVDLKLERIGSDGKVLVRADDAGVGQGEMLPPWRAGDGYVRVLARARDTAFDAPYRLTVTTSEAGPDEEREPNDTPAAATAWANGSPTMRGRLAPRGDEDWYAIEGTGTPASARVDGTLPATARIVDDARHALPPGTPLAAGKRYFVVVKAASEKASNPRELYTVTLTR
jgi:hypothetical protein